MISHLPELVFHLSVIVGALVVVLFVFLRNAVLIKFNSDLILLCAILVFSFGAYGEGAISNESFHQAKIKELQVKILRAEADSAIQNTKIIEKIVYKEKLSRERAATITQFIDREIVKYDNQCVVPTVFIDAHNEATKNK